MGCQLLGAAHDPTQSVKLRLITECVLEQVTDRPHCGHGNSPRAFYELFFKEGEKIMIVEAVAGQLRQHRVRVCLVHSLLQQEFHYEAQGLVVEHFLYGPDDSQYVHRALHHVQDVLRMIYHDEDDVLEQRVAQLFAGQGAELVTVQRGPIWLLEQYVEV